MSAKYMALPTQYSVDFGGSLVSISEEVVDLDSMQFDNNDDQYHYHCKCGHKIKIPRKDLSKGLNVGICPYRNCSLDVRILVRHLNPYSNPMLNSAYINKYRPGGKKSRHINFHNSRMSTDKQNFDPRGVIKQNYLDLNNSIKRYGRQYTKESILNTISIQIINYSYFLMFYWKQRDLYIMNKHQNRIIKYNKILDTTLLTAECIVYVDKESYLYFEKCNKYIARIRIADLMLGLPDFFGISVVDAYCHQFGRFKMFIPQELKDMIQSFIGCG